MSGALDAVAVGIVWDRLIAITNEVVTALVRTSFSTNVRESYDLSCMLFDGRARLIAQGTYSTPSFTGTGPLTVAHMLERFPAETLRPGDVLITNDPWQGTGHIYDVNVLRPIFRRDRIVAYALSITHLPDIGGLGFSATARDVFEEGMRLPICKIVEGGRVDQRLLDLIAANVRTPDQTLGDLHGNIACTEVGERLLREFMDDAELDSLDGVADAIITSSERAVREEIRRFPDGLYRAEMQVEGVDAPITLACSVAIEGDGVAIDFAGTGPEVDVGINVPFTYTRAFAVYTIKCATVPNLPNNLGTVLPVAVTAPERCILNALPPRPTGGRNIIGHYVTPLVMSAIAEALPRAVQADSGMLDLVNVQGTSDRGRNISSIFFSSGGFGALEQADGHPTLPSPSNMTGVPIEVWEDLTGMTIVRKSLLPDSGGPGRRRGGLGQEIVLRNDTGHDITLSCLSGRAEFPPRGFLGGEPGSLRRYEINGAVVHPKRRHVLRPGDLFRIVEPGGGGFGPTSEREPSLVQHDLLHGFVTPDGAVRDYGVARETVAGWLRTGPDGSRRPVPAEREG